MENISHKEQPQDFKGYTNNREHKIYTVATHFLSNYINPLMRAELLRPNHLLLGPNFQFYWIGDYAPNI